MSGSKAVFAEFEFLQVQQKPHYTITHTVDPSASILIVDIQAADDYPDPWVKPITVRYWHKNTAGVISWPAAPDCKEKSRRATTGIPRSTDYKIPRKIFQVWLQATETDSGMQIPSKMHAAISSWRTLNPEYEYFLYNDRMIREFFAHEFPPSYLEAYDLLLPKAFKADFWRYAVLYKYGGVYADSKMTLLKPLRTLIRPNDRVILSVVDDCIAIAFMAFEPGHPMLKDILECIVHMVGRRDKSSHPLALTGPILAADAMRRHFGFVGAPPLGCGPDWQTYAFGRPAEKEKTAFYDADGIPIIEYMYANYKAEDNQEWKHYPALWWSNIVFRDQVPPHVAELPDMTTKPDWLIVNTK